VIGAPVARKVYAQADDAVNRHAEVEILRQPPRLRRSRFRLQRERGPRRGRTGWAMKGRAVEVRLPVSRSIRTKRAGSEMGRNHAFACPSTQFFNSLSQQAPYRRTAYRLALDEVRT
jgi:hypothetical protein